MGWHRGTLAEYITEHTAMKVRFGIPEGGKITYLRGKLAPTRPRTTHYSKPIAHPTNNDDYIWQFDEGGRAASTVYIDAQVKAVGWFPDDGLLD